VDVRSQGVEHQDVVRRGDEVGDKGPSDETGSAGDEYAHTTIVTDW